MKKFPLLLILIIFTAIMNSCKKNPDVPGGPDNPTIPGVPTEGIKVNTSIFGRIVDEADKPLAGVTITGGGSSTTTDENGIYYITNIMLDQARAYIEATKPGYFHGSRIFQPIKNGLSKPPLIKLMQQKSIGTISATAGGAVESKGGTRIEIPANAIKDYTGTINVVANYINPTIADFAARIPGDMAANNSANKRGTLVSLGMSHLDLLDNNGNKLTIKPGSQVTVSLPVPKSLQAKASATIPMWYFDETKGIWTEEGTGTYQNGKYVGKVSHFSIWNYDHFFDFMNLPFILQWMLSKVNPDQNTMDQIMNNPPTFQLTVKDKATKNTLYSNTFPTPSPVPNANPPRSETSVTFPLPNIADVMEVTVTPIQPGGPDYPTNTNYSPNADDVVPPAPQLATEQESVTQEVRPTNPPTTITITIPPAGGGGGNGETVVNVNGKAVNCNNQPVTRGYVVMVMKAGNTIVRTTTAPVFGNEGRFTAQYVFYNALPSRVDNVVLTVYDLQTAKKTKDIPLQLNPSVAYMIQDPVKVCEDNTPPSNDGRVFNGNYSINNATTLKAFIDSAYNTVNGTLYISNVPDLSGITALKKVWGLELRNTPIANLGGLVQLESMSWLTVATCGSLVNLAFPKLANKTMQGIHVLHNYGLAAITLPGIEEISPLGNDNITIVGNPILQTLSIPNLKSVDKCGNIEISNTLLKDLGTFANARGTLGGWGITLVDNPELTTMAAMKNIVLTGRVTIDQNPKLTNLEGCNIPAEVTDWVTITRNEKLTDLGAISNKLTGTGGLTVSINAALPVINFPLMTKGSLSIKDNPSLATISLPKLTDAPGGAILDHNIKVSFINLNSLEKAAGGIILTGGYEPMQALTAFDLPALKSSGRFVLEWCPNITNLDGFNNLESVNGDLTISNSGSPGSAVKLVSVNGFNKLASLPYALSIEMMAGNNYTGSLNQIKGFKILKTIGGALYVGGLNLTDISGFSILESVAQNLRIVKTKLANVNALGKLKSVGLAGGGTINIQGNTSLIDFKGFTSLTSTHGIYIYQNDAITSLDGLTGLTSLPGGVTVTHNKLLANLNGLSNLAGNTNDISIGENTLLRNFCGLTKIANGGGTIANYRVSANAYNPTLADIRAGNCSN